jgi:hypothetical protein
VKVRKDRQLQHVLRKVNKCHLQIKSQDLKKILQKNGHMLAMIMSFMSTAVLWHEKADSAAVRQESLRVQVVAMSSGLL